ncbi:hypothetical protein POX_b02449 [Penicillium oxalicum]|uniref:Uncharacterized protein n=1 Tax=Penicillium oxalicum (strain 114-2 / CGMCC 5302) TaxID=933388 RepID=S8AW97_PENO1|nr:hypothetical protein POX_b02449 [Penicillium oxalicum]EPS30543.1 hypothetical protein PDE_05495 [Penicillium oxalicum 114-2]KAI2792412.1 hypothetical protein POX_b02449 [Penicillium oxalicum]
MGRHGDTATRAMDEERVRPPGEAADWPKCGEPQSQRRGKSAMMNSHSIDQSIGCHFQLMLKLTIGPSASQTCASGNADTEQ